MKIAIVMTAVKAGGIEQTAVPYAYALREQGHDVCLIMSRRSPLLADARKHSLSVRMVAAPWGPWYPTNFLHVLELRRHLRAFEHDAIVALASKGLPQTRRAIGHDYPVLTRSGSTYEHDIRRLMIADHIIVTSDEMAEVAHGYGVDRGKLSVVPNFFPGDVTAHDYDREAPLHIGALGRLVFHKGFDVLMEAVAKLQADGFKLNLTIAGRGSRLKPLGEQADLRQLNVSLPGWIGNANKSEFYKSLDIFVCPSRDEPFGNVYIEAMQLGLPIVTTDNVGSRFIFEGGKGALIVPIDDPDAIANAIAKLVSDSALRRELGEAGHRIFAARFSAAVGGPRLSAVVEKVHRQFHSRAS